MPWLRLSGSVPGPAAAALGERLNALGAVAVAWLDAGDAPVLEPAPGAPPAIAAWREARVEGLFRLDAELATLREAFAGAPVQVDFVADEDWSHTWRRFAPTRRFGPLVVAPVDAPAPTGAVVLRLDPGMAFGTGAHATTQLCLDWLAARPLAAKTVLDYGCGSGILAIAATLLGARRVVAVDNDPQALAATAANAARNGVRVETVASDAYRPQAFDVVVANILADALAALAPRLGASVAPTGELALCGVLAPQAGRLAARYGELGLAVSTSACAEGWALLSGAWRRA